MNREIKFRAWWTGGDEWLYFNNKKDKSLAFQIGGDNIEIYQKEDEPKEFYLQDGSNEEIIWCQYTGLKDKNGVEIYEGDILTHHLQGRREVIYPMNDSFACYGLKAKNGMVGTLQDCDRLYEVIGNIYENKELLDG